MAEVWYYEVNGFELGPVPTAEIHRLLAKGRVAADTPIRPHNGGQWKRVHDVTHVPRLANAKSDPWPVALLDRWAVVGIPLGVALILTDQRPAFIAGMVLLTPFAVAFARVAVELRRGLKT